MNGMVVHPQINSQSLAIFIRGDHSVGTFIELLGHHQCETENKSSKFWLLHGAIFRLCFGESTSGEFVNPSTGVRVPKPNVSPNDRTRCTAAWTTFSNHFRFSGPQNLRNRRWCYRAECRSLFRWPWCRHAWRETPSLGWSPRCGISHFVVRMDKCLFRSLPEMAEFCCMLRRTPMWFYYRRWQPFCPTQFQGWWPFRLSDMHHDWYPWKISPTDQFASKSNQPHYV